jgi:8-oxo-dGTP diphosphatase
MKVVPVTCALIVENGKLLCAQRSETMTLPLKWELPGGKIEPNESEEECIKREIEEELGLKIEIRNRFEPNQHFIKSDVQIVLIPFLCEIVGGNLFLAEHKAVIWLDFQELFDLDWAEADLPIINQFIQSQP